MPKNLVPAAIWPANFTVPVEGEPRLSTDIETPVQASANALLYLKTHRDAIRPEEYSATGDGVADDTAELQAAIDAASTAKQSLYLTGTYKVSAALGLKSNLHIFGPGKIVLDGAAAIAALGSASIRILTNLTGGRLSNVVLEGITIDGNHDAWIGSVTAGNRGAASGGIRLNAIDGLVVRDVKFVDCFDGAITMSDVDTFFLVGLSISNYYGIGITLNDCNMGAIQGCVIKDGHELFSMYNRTASNGIFTYDSCRDLTISGNVVIDQTDVGIEIGYQGVAPAQNVTVANNTIRSRQTSQKYSASIAVAMTADAVTATLSDASAFPTSGTILVGGEMFDYTGKVGNDLTGLTRGTYYTTAAIHNIGEAVQLAVFPSGIFILGTIDAAVTGNVITGCFGDGIKVDKGAVRVAITGNEIRDGYRAINLGNVRDTAKWLEKILVEGNILDAKDFVIYVQGDGATGAQNHVDVSLKGNTIWKSANLQGQTGIKALGTAGKPIKNLSITGNKISNQGYGINVLYVEDAQVQGNMLRDCYRPVANFPYYTLGGVFYVQNSSKVALSDNFMINCRAGSGAIKVETSSKVWVERNRILDPDSPSTTLQTVMDATTGYASIDVGDASVLPTPSGAVASRGYFVIIGDEIFEYTAKTGNTLTIRASGRGFLDSPQETHAIADPVYLCTPSIVVEADTDCVVKDNEAIGRLARLIDYSDVGGAATHTRPRYEGNRAGVDGDLYSRTILSGAAATLRPFDRLVRVKKTAGSATALTLPANPVAGQEHTVKDANGDVGLYPITVSPAAGTIDGAATSVIDSPYAAITYRYDGSEWNRY